ncbi:hypothetical protein CYMTET_22661, partial [Cymbomonas tetramitiformis]
EAFKCGGSLEGCAAMWQLLLGRAPAPKKPGVRTNQTGGSANPGAKEEELDAASAPLCAVLRAAADDADCARILRVLHLMEDVGHGGRGRADGWAASAWKCEGKLRDTLLHVQRVLRGTRQEMSQPSPMPEEETPPSEAPHVSGEEQPEGPALDHKSASEDDGGSEREKTIATVAQALRMLKELLVIGGGSRKCD